MNTKQQAIDNDHRLMDLARYAYTEGNLNARTLSPTEGRKINSKFREFKHLVKRGTFTMEQLEDHICGIYGITDRTNNPEFDFLNEPIKE